LTTGFIASIVFATTVAGAQSDTANLTEPQSDALAAKVGSMTITLDDIDSAIGRDAYNLKLKLYTLRMQALSSLIDRIVLNNEATGKQMPEQVLLEKITANIKAPPQEGSREWFENYETLRPLGEVIGSYKLTIDAETRLKAEAIRKYIDRLKDKTDVKVALEKPQFILISRSPKNVLGNFPGKTSLIVFMDYECPYCRKLDPSLQKLADSSGVSIEIKQFPLEMHSTAFQASMAAVCASKQNRFRQMHEQLLQTPTHDKSTLLKSARLAGLTLDAFQQCLVSKDAEAVVVADMMEGKKSGIQGTPSLFLNGVPLESIDDLDELQSQILRSADSSPILIKANSRRDGN
jgi:protein-disulfide isomerase